MSVSGLNLPLKLQADDPGGLEIVNGGISEEISQLGEAGVVSNEHQSLDRFQRLLCQVEEGGDGGFVDVIVFFEDAAEGFVVDRCRSASPHSRAGEDTIRVNMVLE